MIFITMIKKDPFGIKIKSWLAESLRVKVLLIVLVVLYGIDFDLK